MPPITFPAAFTYALFDFFEKAGIFFFHPLIGPADDIVNLKPGILRVKSSALRNVLRTTSTVSVHGHSHVSMWSSHGANPELLQPWLQASSFIWPPQ